MGEKWAGISGKVAAAAAPVVAGFVTPFFWGLILWLVGAKVLKGSFPYMKAVEVIGLANMVCVLEVIVRTLLIVGMGNLYAAPSLMLLVKEFNPQNPVHSLLAVVNVMTFWVLAVRAIGLARLSGASVAKAALWVFGIWAAYTGLFHRPWGPDAGGLQAHGHMRTPEHGRGLTPERGKPLFPVKQNPFERV